MSPRQFWKSTPRKLCALSKVHAEINGGNKNKSSKGKTLDKPETTVDNLPFM